MRSVSEQVDRWVAEMDVPSSARLQVARAERCPFVDADDCREWAEMTEEDRATEWEAYYEWIQQHMNRQHHVILSIPEPGPKPFVPIETDDAISFPFSSSDFKRLYPPMPKHHWAHQAILDRIKGLAQTYSVVCGEIGKEKEHLSGRRYLELVRVEYGEQAEAIEQAIRLNPHGFRYAAATKRLEELKRKIWQCEKAWKTHAYTL